MRILDITKVSACQPRAISASEPDATKRVYQPNLFSAGIGA